MKRAVTILFCCILSSFVQAQPLLERLPGELSPAESSAAEIKLQEVRAEFLKSSNRNDVRQLRLLQRLVRTTFLKEYTPHARLEETFSSGKYDCLTATVLYSALLSEANVPHEVIETNYHIFLLISTRQGKVLLETTDPFNGLVTTEEAVAARMETYRHQEAVARHGRPANHYSFEIFRPVSDDGLIGLLSFNQAVRAFNEQRWVACSEALKQSSQLHDSPRCAALAGLLMDILHRNGADAGVQGRCTQNISGIHSGPSVTALED